MSAARYYFVPFTEHFSGIKCQWTWHVFREQHCCKYWNIGCCMCTCSSQMSFQYIGVRSLSFRDLLLTVGTGLGSLFFFDMRTCSFLAHRDTDQMLCYRSGKGWLVRNYTDLSILRTLSGTLDQIGMQDNSYLTCKAAYPDFWPCVALAL